MGGATIVPELSEWEGRSMLSSRSITPGILITKTAFLLRFGHLSI